MNRGLLILLAFVIIIAIPAEAQRNAGRNAAVFLEVGVGAREAALGSAVTAQGNTANQIFWNPAGTALRVDQQADATVSYGKWIGDINYTAAAAGYNFGSSGTVTLGLQAFGVSDIPANRENGYLDPILQDLVTDHNTSETYSFQDIAVSASYSRYFFDRLTLGATAKWVNETIDSESASALAFDFGSTYEVMPGWQLAARLNNLGTSMTYFNQDNPLPLLFSIGTSYYPINTEQTRVMLALDAFKAQDSQQALFGGTEVSFFDLLFLRGGYKFNYSGANDGGTDARPSISTSIEQFSLGGGIQYAMGDYAVGVDYAFTKMDLLDDVHRVTLRVGF